MLVRVVLSLHIQDIQIRKYLSDGVGLAAVGDLGSVGAVGDVLVNDIGNNGDVARRNVDGRNANGGESDSSGELHFVGIRN